MHRIDDPGEMTTDQRFREIAALLARGCLRRKRGAALATISGESAEIPENSPKSRPDSLEVPGEMRLSVRAG